MQRKGNSALEKHQEKAAGLQQVIDDLNAEKSSFTQQIGELSSQIQKLQDEKKEAESRAQEELEQKARELYEAHHVTANSNVRSSLS